MGGRVPHIWGITASRHFEKDVLNVSLQSSTFGKFKSIPEVTQQKRPRG